MMHKSYHQLTIIIVTDWFDGVLCNDSIRQTTPEGIRFLVSISYW